MGVKQNKGARAKEMRGASSGTPLKPRKGTCAVEMKGTFVHAEHHAGITRPHHHEAGSHDHKVREHAEHED